MSMTSEVAPLETSADLAELGPLELVNGSYTPTVVGAAQASCSAGGAQSSYVGSVLVADLIEDSTFTAFVAGALSAGWTGSVAASGGTQRVVMNVTHDGPCTSGETIAVISGMLHNGNAYTLTVISD